MQFRSAVARRAPERPPPPFGRRRVGPMASLGVLCAAVKKATAEVLKALAQVDRLHVLEALAAVDRLSPKDAADQVGIPLGNGSYHVRALLDAGLIEDAGT